jgi:hypothetical protein
MSEFQAMKDRAVRRVMRDGAATYVDRLAKELVAQVPAITLFTRDDVVALLEGMAEHMRQEEP